MDFELSPAHEEVRERSRKLARDVVAPRAADIDAQGVYPHDIFAALREAKLLGLSLPVEYGGAPREPARWDWRSRPRRSGNTVRVRR